MATQAAYSQNSVDFSNTEIAFSALSDEELLQAYWLFKVIGQPWVVALGPGLANFALKSHLPIQGLIRKTIFAHFCGGESITDCLPRIQSLARFNIGTILDFAREGAKKEDELDAIAEEIKLTIEEAAQQQSVPFAVFKPTGIARLSLLTKMEKGDPLNADEKKAADRIQERFAQICAHAAARNVRIMVDAEESWIQKTVDSLVHQAMQEHNQKQAIVFNTVQLYRHDRLDYLQAARDTAEKEGYYLGFKLVRGAYLEKENQTAKDEGRPSPLNPSKEATDEAYNKALNFSVKHIERIAICAGTHNEASALLLTQLMQAKGLRPGDPRISFAQLLGMSDHISYNLAAKGYNVAKYVPYGKVKELLPYLTRRAQENSSVTGQSSRELKLISDELRRRRKK